MTTPHPLLRTCLGAACVLATSHALALQPIRTFLEGVRANPDNREALALTAQREAEAGVTLARLMPSFSARGSYTRNQYEVKLSMLGSTLTVQPYNQLDAALSIDVPIVDLASWARHGAQKSLAEVSRASQEVTSVELQKQVIRTWYQLVGATSLTESANRSLELAVANASQVRNRRDGGIASDLDVSRAEASIERARQDVGDAELIVTMARRNLETLTGVVPQPVDIGLSDDLREEMPLSTFLDSAEAGSAVLKQAAAQVRAAERSADAARWAYLPSLAGNAQQRLTNATGFSGHKTYYTVSATASWRLDFGIAPTLRAQDASVEATRARREKVVRSVRDQIHESWHRVRTGIAKCRASRAQVAAADKASTIASDRYATGAATQIEVIQAQRDLFAANVARIQADADLAVARAMLRLNAGRNP